MMEIKTNFRKGAASFYIVAFSTLILMIVAISFAAVIISEVERTSNDDLSQSAYDSALAGIEDAKLAYYNYQNCLEQNDAGTSGDSAVSCSQIIAYMDNANSSEGSEECNTVWNILGRGSLGGKVVETTTGMNNMQQETTCITITDELNDYRGTLSSSSMVDVIQLSFVDDVANEIDKMVLRWFSKEDAIKTLGENNKLQSMGNKFQPLPIAPPVVSLTVLQTGPSFTMDSFNQVGDGQTNRGMLYFVPNKGGETSVEAKALVKSNDKTYINNPINVNCAEEVSKINGEFACAMSISLPKPVGGVRSNDTFEVVVSLPYGQPSTEFSLEFYCKNGVQCGSEEGDIVTDESGSQLAKLKGVQLEVDSTGRANDLYRRVITRLKGKNDLALSVMGPLELLDSGGEDEAGLKKMLTVTKEYDF